MAFEKMIKNAFNQSRDNCRYGDTLEEIAEIQDYIKNAKSICIPNKTGIKVKVLNKVLKEYGLPQAEILQIDTNTADTSRIPALAKAYIALDQCECDLINRKVGISQKTDKRKEYCDCKRDCQFLC